MTLPKNEIDSATDPGAEQETPVQLPPGIRVLYAAGPGDLVAQYRDLEAGREPRYQVALSWTRQFLDAWMCAGGGNAHVISRCMRSDRLQVGDNLVENRPPSALFYQHGIRHYAGTLGYGLSMVAQAVRNRVSVAIIDSGTARWFMISLFALLRIPVFAVLHSSLWPMGFPPQRRLDRILVALDAWFFRHFPAAILCVSPEVERQVAITAGKPSGPFYQFRPQYREAFFCRVPPVPEWPFRPFNVLFLGRLEENKGVFLMLDIAERMERGFPGCFRWRIVGEGSASEPLRAEVRQRNLGGIVGLPGSLQDESAALEALGWSHVMIVPTTSCFKEALAMTACESILAGRPVVLSSVVPAREILGDAVVTVEPDSAEPFIEALRQLAFDRAYYEERRKATETVRAQFYDGAQGLGRLLVRAVANFEERSGARK